MAIACYDDVQWEALCRLIQRPELLSDPRFADSLSRHRHQQELAPFLEGWTAARTPQEAMEQLQDAGVPAGALLSNKDLYFDPHLKARGYFVADDHPELGRRPVPGPAFKLSRTPGKIRWPTPLLGQHNELVLQDFLGMSAAEVEGLRQRQIIGNEPVPNLPREVIPFSVWRERGAITTVDSDYLEQLGMRRPGEPY